MRFPSVAATEVTTPDALMTVLKRYLRESNESEIVLASRPGVNRHTPKTIVSPRPKDNRTNADYDKSFSMVEFNTDRSHGLVKCAENPAASLW